MKSLVTIIILSCIVAASFAQRVPSSCNAPDSIVALYDESAAKMAYVHMLNRDSTYADSVNVPQSVHARLLRGLIAVYNSGLPDADAVTGKVNFYDPIIEVNGSFFVLENYYSFRYIQLHIDTSISWENNLVNFKVPTGNKEVDSFLNAYNLTIDTMPSGSGRYRTARLKTSVLQNTLAIARQWNRITDTLTNALPENYYFWASDGGGIDATLTDSSIALSYTESWGDCPSGCIWSHTWLFTVFDDCSVQSDGSFGTPLRVSSVHSIDQNTDLTLYPNPTTGRIAIETEAQSTIEIIDIQGKLLEKILSSEERTEMDISSLFRGTYFVRVTSKTGMKSTAKFIKE